MTFLRGHAPGVPARFSPAPIRSCFVAACLAVVVAAPAACGRRDRLEPPGIRGGRRPFPHTGHGAHRDVRCGQRHRPALHAVSDAPGAATRCVAASGGGRRRTWRVVRLFPGQRQRWPSRLRAPWPVSRTDRARPTALRMVIWLLPKNLRARIADNMLAPGPTYVPGPNPGDYQLTGPQPVNTGAPSWVPFALTAASQFRPNGPAALSGPQYAADLEETHTWGGVISIRDADQDQIARWHTEQSPFQYNRIARTETAVDGRSLLDHTRFFALLNIALADSITAVFEARYDFNAWRPWTAINSADLDGNDRTVAAPTWRPFLPTPPHPEYPAAHGAAHAAPARILKAYLGPNYSFCTTSPTVANAVRCYATPMRTRRGPFGAHLRRDALPSIARRRRSTGQSRRQLGAGHDARAARLMVGDDWLVGPRGCCRVQARAGLPHVCALDAFRRCCQWLCSQHEGRQAQADLAAVPHRRRPGDRRLIHPGSVLAAQVFDHRAAAGDRQTGVMP